jgi:hypothetical protein
MAVKRPGGITTKIDFIQGKCRKTARGVHSPTLLTNVDNFCLYQVYNNDYNSIVYQYS